MVRKSSRVRTPLVDRVQYLVQRCSRAQRVAHLGCTDSPFTEERIRTGSLLHSRLAEVAEVDGFDVDEKAVAILAERFPDQSFVVADVGARLPDDATAAYDLVVAGEVLEHVPDIGVFLRGCRRLLAQGGLLCVTVPSGISPKSGLQALIGREIVHPDHFVYFGPRTLERALGYAGFEVLELATYLATADPLGRAVDAVNRLSHAVFKGPVGDGLIATARVADGR